MALPGPAKGLAVATVTYINFMGFRNPGVSIYLVSPLGEASRRAEPEPASGRASKLWLRTARIVDIGY